MRSRIHFKASKSGSQSIFSIPPKLHGFRKVDRQPKCLSLDPSIEHQTLKVFDTIVASLDPIKNIPEPQQDSERPGSTLRASPFMPKTPLITDSHRSSVMMDVEQSSQAHRSRRLVRTSMSTSEKLLMLSETRQGSMIIPKIPQSWDTKIPRKLSRSEMLRQSRGYLAKKLKEIEQKNIQETQPLMELNDTRIKESRSGSQAPPSRDEFRNSVGGLEIKNKIQAICKKVIERTNLDSLIKRDNEPHPILIVGSRPAHLSHLMVENFPYLAGSDEYFSESIKNSDCRSHKNPNPIPPFFRMIHNRLKWQHKNPSGKTISPKFGLSTMEPTYETQSTTPKTDFRIVLPRGRMPKTNYSMEAKTLQEIVSRPGVGSGIAPWNSSMEQSYSACRAYGI